MSIPPGRYQATVTASALGKAQMGSEQLAIGLDVHLGDEAQSQPMTWYGYFSDKAWPITEKALKALGWNPAEHDFRLDELNPAEPTETPLKGAECTVVIEDDPTESDPDRVVVRWINGSGGGIALKERMDGATASAFTGSLRSRLIAQAGPGAVKTAPRPAAARPAAAKPATKPAAAHPVLGKPIAGVDPATASSDVTFDDLPF